MSFRLAPADQSAEPGKFRYFRGRRMRVEAAGGLLCRVEVIKVPRGWPFVLQVHGWFLFFLVIVSAVAPARAEAAAPSFTLDLASGTGTEVPLTVAAPAMVPF